jgi:hypothetical protein
MVISQSDTTTGEGIAYGVRCGRPVFLSTPRPGRLREGEERIAVRIEVRDSHLERPERKRGERALLLLLLLLYSYVIFRLCPYALGLQVGGH